MDNINRMANYDRVLYLNQIIPNIMYGAIVDYMEEHKIENDGVITCYCENYSYELTDHSARRIRGGLFRISWGRLHGYFYTNLRFNADTTTETVIKNTIAAFKTLL